MRKPTELARFSSVRQGEPRGLGHAVLCARAAVGNEPFAVLLGDDLLDAQVPGIGQLIDAYQRLGTGVIALKEVPADQAHLYGIADGERDGARGLKISKLVEKPAPGTTSSRAAVIGRYVLPPEIFQILADTPPGPRRRDSAHRRPGHAVRRSGLYGLEVEGDRFDVGDRAGYVVAMVHYALKRDDIRDDVRAGIEKLLRK